MGHEVRRAGQAGPQVSLPSLDAAAHRGHGGSMTTMSLPIISTCSAEGCSYNHDHDCHAAAITVLNHGSAACGTFVEGDHTAGMERGRPRRCLPPGGLHPQLRARVHRRPHRRRRDGRRRGLPDLRAGLTAGRQEQVLPLHRRRRCERVVAERGERRVELGRALRVVGDGAVDGDGRARRSRLKKSRNSAPSANSVDPQVCASRAVTSVTRSPSSSRTCVLAAPQRRRLRTGRGRRRVRLHGREHLADEAFRRPAEQPDRAAGPARPGPARRRPAGGAGRT